MSKTNDITPPSAGNPAQGEAAPLQPYPGCNVVAGVEDGMPKPPIKLTRVLLKARAASSLSSPPPKPEYDGFDDGDGAELDDGCEDHAASRAEVDEALAEADEAESHLQSTTAAKEAQVQTLDKTESPMHEPVVGPAGFSFTDKWRKWGLRKESVPRMLAGPREQFVSHLVRRPDVLRLARPHLRPEHFSLIDEKPHQIIVRQLFVLHDAGPIPPVGPTFAALHGVLAELIKPDHGGVETGSLFGHPQAEMQKLADELYGDAGAPRGPGLLRRIFALPAESLDDQQGFTLLRQFLVERDLSDPLAELFRDLDSHVPRDLAATLDVFQTRARTFAALGAPHRSFREEMDGLLDTLSEGWGRELLGLKTGMGRLDKLLGGLQGLTVLGAPPGTGKTVLVTQLGLGVAEHPGDNDAVVVFLVLDMAKEVILTRVLSYVTGIDYEVITKGSRGLRQNPTGPFVTEADWAKLEAGVDRLRAGGADDRLFFLGREDVGAGVSAASLRAILDACKAKAGARRALLIIDYLQLLPGPPTPPPSSMGARQVPMKAEDPMEAARRLIEVVQDAIRPPEGTPSWARDAALVVSETRKAPTGTNGKSEQTLDDLMGTTRLAYAADAILLLRPMTDLDVARVYTVQKDSVTMKRSTLKADRITPLILKIEKARDGSYRGDVPLEFEYTRSTMTPVYQPFGDDPTVGPLHPANPAPPPSTPQTQPGASAGDPVGDGHVDPASASAEPEVPQAPQGPPGQVVVPSGAATTGTATEKVLAALQDYPSGETANVVAKGAKLPNDKAKQALDKLAADGLVVAIKVTKVAGKGLKTFDGFALASAGAHQGTAATKPV